MAEHLDHLHYLNDILCLDIDALNEVLTEHLLNNLFLPLYVYSLTKTSKYHLPTVSHLNHRLGVRVFLDVTFTPFPPVGLLTQNNLCRPCFFQDGVPHISPVVSLFLLSQVSESLAASAAYSHTAVLQLPGMRRWDDVSFWCLQVFLIMKHKPLVRQLADIIFNSDLAIFEPVPIKDSSRTVSLL